MPTIDYLKSQLDYRANSGDLVWKVTRNRVVEGQLAGNKHLGYIRVKLNGRNYAAHRIAWLFETGKWPTHEIDHINGNRSDNRICNLREATHSQNLQNCVNRNPNKHGLRGVTKQTCSNRWIAQVTANGVKHYLGTYATAEEAHSAYLNVVKQTHGNFANLQTANHKEIPMSRKSSVVLSPAEIKAALKEAKQVLKDAAAAAKVIGAEAKAVAKARAAEDKEFGKRAAAADKAVAAATSKVEALTAE